MSKIISVALGATFGLALPIMGMSGSAFLTTVYWTVVLFLFGAYMLQECKGSLVNRD